MWIYTFDVLLVVVLCWLCYKLGYKRAWDKLCRDYIVFHKTTKFRPIRIIMGGTLISDGGRKDLKAVSKNTTKEKNNEKLKSKSKKTRQTTFKQKR